MTENEGCAKSEKHVRFAEIENEKNNPPPINKTATEEKNVKQSRPPAPARRQVKDVFELLSDDCDAPPLIQRHVGSANLKRDLPMFFILLGLLFLIAFMLDDTGKPMKKRASAKDSLATVREALRNKLESSFKAIPERTIECALFLAESSMPGDHGFGIYAGKDFTVGASLVSSAITYLSTKLLLVGPTHTIFGSIVKKLNTTNVAYAIQKNLDFPYFVSQFGFLVKHHHLLHNLESSVQFWSSANDFREPTSSEWKATRNIAAGEELYLRFDDHPNKVMNEKNSFPSYPTEADYALAKEICDDERNTFRPMRKRKTTKERPPDASIFRLMRKTVERFHPNVGNLLPWSIQALDRIRPDVPFSLTILRNKTMNWLSRNGRCLDDVVPRVTGSTVSLVANRHFQSGDMVLPVPLYITTTLDDNTCSSTSSSSLSSESDGDESPPTTECRAWQEDFVQHCYGHNQTKLLLCPLSTAVYATRTVPSAKNANVKFQWSTWHRHNKLAQAKGADEVRQSFSHRLSWDLIATKEIQPGDEIKLEVASGSVRFGAAIPQGLLPSAWRQKDAHV